MPTHVDDKRISVLNSLEKVGQEPAIDLNRYGVQVCLFNEPRHRKVNDFQRSWRRTIHNVWLEL